LTLTKVPEGRATHRQRRYLHWVSLSDLAYLSIFHSPAPGHARPVNIFQIAGFPRRETVASNVLAYFLTADERHGLENLFVDSLLGLLDGCALLGRYGATGGVLVAESPLGSGNWTVGTEVGTDERNRIDILLTNDDPGRVSPGGRGTPTWARVGHRGIPQPVRLGGLDWVTTLGLRFPRGVRCRPSLGLEAGDSGEFVAREEPHP